MMNDTELRMALLLGWLIQRLARAEQRGEIDVAADALAYAQKRLGLDIERFANDLREHSKRS